MIKVAPSNNFTETAHFTCNGINDSQVIQSAIIEAGVKNSHVQFLSGIFYITDPIVITNPWRMTLEGSGASTIFYNKSNDYCFIATGDKYPGSNVKNWFNHCFLEIRKIFFTQIAPSAPTLWLPTEDPDYSSWGTNTGKGILLSGLSNSIVEDCYFHGLAGTGIRLQDWSWNNRIVNNMFYLSSIGLPGSNPWGTGSIQFSDDMSVHDTKITGNLFSGTEPELGGNQRYVCAIWGGAAVNLEITNNKFEQFTQFDYNIPGLCRAVRWGAGNSFEFTDNTLEAVDIGVDLCGAFIDNQGVMINDNRFYDTRIGIVSGGYENVNTPIISGNIFKASHEDGVYPIYLYNPENIVKSNHLIIGNKFDCGTGKAITCKDESNVNLSTFIIANNWYKDYNGDDILIEPLLEINLL
mgnify:CR=1 FL=1